METCTENATTQLVVAGDENFDTVTDFDIAYRGVGATGASQALALVDFQRCSENFIAKSNL